MRPSEAFHVTSITVMVCALTAVPSILIVLVAVGTIDGRTAIAASNVRAYIVASVANIPCLALVNVNAASPVGSQLVPMRATARIRAGSIFTNSHTKISRLVLLTLIHIVTGAIVVAYPIARVATALVRAPIVFALLMAQPRYFRALIHIVALLIVRTVTEALLTFAPKRTDRVDAVRNWLANLWAMFRTFVNVLAALVPADHVSRRTFAHEATLLVPARLLWTTFRHTCSALVDVQTLRYVIIHAIARWTGEKVPTAVRTVRVDALLMPMAHASPSALIHIYACSKGVALEPNPTRWKLRLIRARIRVPVERPAGRSTGCGRRARRHVVSRQLPTTERTLGVEALERWLTIMPSKGTLIVIIAVARFGV